MVVMQSQMKKSKSARWFGFPHKMGLGVLGVFLTLSLVHVGCNNYPMQAMVNKSYLEQTEIIPASTSRKVDILFVVDNSGSMQEEQEKLRRNFSAFIEKLVQYDINDFQIGVVTTDMSDPAQQGRLQGEPRIIRSLSMSKSSVIQTFLRNVNVGTTGTGYEKPLDAMRAALSQELTGSGGYNKGFLRPGATLAVIFMTDEDDCSHNGSIKEMELDSDVCRLPQSQFLRDPATGSILKDSQGNNVRGQLEQLTPTSTYIDFLRNLKQNRSVVVAGIIGNPIVLRPGTNRPIDPEGGCRQDIECSTGESQHRCSYTSPTQRTCGGCLSTDTGPTPVAPAFRVHNVIKAFGGGSQWFSICGDDQGFQEALLRFAKIINEAPYQVRLSRAPVETEGISVHIVPLDGKKEIKLQQAILGTKVCQGNIDCGETICSQTQRLCYGDGWVLEFDGRQHLISLSGKAKAAITPNSKVKIVYAAKPKP